MKAASIAYAIGSTRFGILVRWVIATQQMSQAAPPPAAAAAAAPASANAPRTLAEGRVQALKTIITSHPKNEDAVIQLANTYFAAERWDDTIQWYEQALK